MWYWLVRIQGIIFAPLLAAYCALRGVPFFFRCRKCSGWLDYYHLLPGICEKCERKMIQSNIVEYYVDYQDKRVDYEQKKLAKLGFLRRTAFDTHYKWVIGRINRGGKILDVGCDGGHLLHQLQLRHKLDSYGIDLVFSSLKIAKNSVKGADFCLANAENMPFQSDIFDYVVCMEMLEHLTEKQCSNVLNEIYRVIKPGGVALVTVPNGRGPSGKISVPHIRSFTFKSIVAVTKEAGFEIVAGEKIGLYIPFVSPCIVALVEVSGGHLPFRPYLGIHVPEFLAVMFLNEFRKPVISKK